MHGQTHLIVIRQNDACASKWNFNSFFLFEQYTILVTIQFVCKMVEIFKLLLVKRDTRKYFYGKLANKKRKEIANIHIHAHAYTRAIANEVNGLIFLEFCIHRIHIISYSSCGMKRLFSLLPKSRPPILEMLQFKQIRSGKWPKKLVFWWISA